MAREAFGPPSFLLHRAERAGSVANMIHEETVVSRPPGSYQILKLDSGHDGVPHSIAVEGFVKCLICQGSSHNHMICEECRHAVILIRSAGNFETLSRLVTVLDDRPYILNVLERITDEVIAKLLFQRTTGHDLPDPD